MGFPAMASGVQMTDVLFVDLPNDMHLDPATTGLDAGDPEAEPCLEPAPNGCLVNVGAYGGTSEATPSLDGADHCQCP